VQSWKESNGEGCGGAVSPCGSRTAHGGYSLSCFDTELCGVLLPAFLSRFLHSISDHWLAFFSVHFKTLSL